MRRDVRAEIRVANDLLINLHFLGEAQVVGHLHHHDTIEDRLVGVVGLELLPFGFVGMRDDGGVDIRRAVTTRRGSLFPASP